MSAMDKALEAVKAEGARVREFLASLPSDRDGIIAAYLEYNKASIIRAQERLK